MKVENLMTRYVATCHPLDSLNEAARLMWERDCGCIPIIDEQNRVIGIITDRDICIGALFHGISLKDIPVGTVMSCDVVVSGPQMSIQMAQVLMEQNQIRRLPVISDEAHLLGMLTLNDIALGYKQNGNKIGAKELANTIAAISAHHQTSKAGIVVLA